MKIGIDVRMAGVIHGGIGRYVLELAGHLLAINDNNEYYLFFNDDGSIEPLRIAYKGIRAKFIKVNIRHYSLAEQIFFPFILNKYQLDLAHFPNFNIPLLYKKPFVVTIHDLIHHKFGGVKKTNFFNFAAYKKIIRHAAVNSKKIITVSNSSKHDIVSEYDIFPDKISVVYEGTTLGSHQPSFNEIAGFKAKFYLNKPFFLFVGVMQRNKNLIGLCRGFVDFLKKYKLDFDLVIAGKADPHYPNIKEQCLKIDKATNFIFTGALDDADLKLAYAGAYAFVSASAHEGFGLPGLEAMSFGLPLAVSNIPVFNEIYEDGAIYFDPNNPGDIAKCLNLLAQDRLYYMQIKQKALQRSKFFSWEKCASETIEIYNQILSP